ncbi:MAG: Ribonuclease HII [bacterium]|nr:Ribonuclease HII [bacterium]
MNKLKFERTLWGQGLTHVAGVDEAGRGPLAGPVVAAAVVFPREFFLPGVDDSKKLSHERREQLYPQILASCLTYGVSIVPVEEIDRINIYQAAMLAMRQALAQLSPAPQHVLVDGRQNRMLDLPQTAIVKGDSLSFTIGAASIIAKVERDRLMLDYHRVFPQYGFDKHKGYATRSHLAALQQFGPCAIHRRSFHPKALAG